MGIVLIIGLSVCRVQAIPIDNPFVFDEKKVDVGTMYVYEVSRNNIDGFKPGTKNYIYIKALNEIEIMQMSVKDTKAYYLIKYKMNWDYMMFEKAVFLYLLDQDKLAVDVTVKATDSIDFSKGMVLATLKNKAENGFKEVNASFKLKSIPTYFYKLTDLIELWFVLRFYPFQKEYISVNHNESGYNMGLDIKYQGKEVVEVPYGKILCHKFKLVPKLSLFMRIIAKPKDTWMWITSEDNAMYMVKYRNNNERDVFTRNMEYRLDERKKLTLDEWENLKAMYHATVGGE